MTLAREASGGKSKSEWGGGVANDEREASGGGACVDEGNPLTGETKA